MTERAQNADFRRKPQIFADSPLLLEIPAFGGRRKPQKTADFRRKPKIFAENRRKPQIGLRHLRCVTFSSSLVSLICSDLFWKQIGTNRKKTEQIGTNRGIPENSKRKSEQIGRKRGNRNKSGWPPSADPRLGAPRKGPPFHVSGGGNLLPKFLPILFLRRVSRFIGVSGHLALQ